MWFVNSDDNSLIPQVAFNVDVDVIRDANSPFPSEIAKGLEGIEECLRSPFWQLNVAAFSYQRRISETAKFIRDYGKKVIQARQEAISRGEDTPSDILAHILSVAEAEPTLTLENLVDEFVTFYVAGKHFFLQVFFFSLEGLVSAFEGHETR